MNIVLENLAAQAILRARPDDSTCFKLIIRNKEVLCVPCTEQTETDWPVIGLQRHDLTEGLSSRQWNTVSKRLEQAKKQGKL